MLKSILLFIINISTKSEITVNKLPVMWKILSSLSYIMSTVETHCCIPDCYRHFLSTYDNSARIYVFILMCGIYTEHFCRLHWCCVSSGKLFYVSNGSLLAVLLSEFRRLTDIHVGTGAYRLYKMRLSYSCGCGYCLDPVVLRGLFKECYSRQHSFEAFHTEKRMRYLAWDQTRQIICIGLTVS